jgi:ribonuclease-3
LAELNDQERLALLAARLGLPEGTLQPALALEALRHGSWLHEHREQGDGLRSNERLEFLGDAVLGLLVSERCFARFPGYAEGDLTRLRAALVRADSLAGIARSIELGELLLLGRGEERSGGRDKQNLLADALEAVLAAVYLSCGLPAVGELVDRLLAPLFAQATQGALGRDYKTELQERLQSTHRAAPSYQLIDAPGPQHARIFEVEVRFNGQAIGQGTGRTKKEAEQAAARASLESGLEALQAAPPDPVDSAADGTGLPAAGRLP